MAKTRAFHGCTNQVYFLSLKTEMVKLSFYMHPKLHSGSQEYQIFLSFFLSSSSVFFFFTILAAFDTKYVGNYSYENSICNCPIWETMHNEEMEVRSAQGSVLLFRNNREFPRRYSFTPTENFSFLPLYWFTQRENLRRQLLSNRSIISSTREFKKLRRLLQRERPIKMELGWVKQFAFILCW